MVGVDVVGFAVGLDVVGFVVGVDFVGFAVGLDILGFVVGLLGCIFLLESSGFLYFPFLSPVFHRNLNFGSAVTLFFRKKKE